MYEHILLALMLLIHGILLVTGLRMLKEVHRITNETLLKVSVGFDFRPKQ